jgi:methionyl-tRNA synthetase
MNIPAVVQWNSASDSLRDECNNMLKEFYTHMDDYMFHHALARVWKYIHTTNAYFHGQEPWKIVKSNPALFTEILSATCHSLRVIAILLLPVMPQKMDELLASLGMQFELGKDTLENAELQSWNRHFALKKIPTLFEKPAVAEASDFAPSFAKSFGGRSKATSDKMADGSIREIIEGKSMQQEELKNTVVEQQQNYITIDDVAKVELYTGTIEACIAVESSDKLVQMTIDLGEIGKRTILAGIRKSYQPEELIGKRGLFITNLKPRKMAGTESQGMMLVAEDETGKMQLVQFPDSVKNGVRLR